jgi:hypothetical protein
MRGVRRYELLNEKIMAAVWMKASRAGVWVVVRGSAYEPGSIIEVTLRFAAP